MDFICSIIIYTAGPCPGVPSTKYTFGLHNEVIGSANSRVNIANQKQQSLMPISAPPSNTPTARNNDKHFIWAYLNILSDLCRQSASLAACSQLTPLSWLLKEMESNSPYTKTLDVENEMVLDFSSCIFRSTKSSCLFYN